MPRKDPKARAAYLKEYCRKKRKANPTKFNATNNAANRKSYWKHRAKRLVAQRARRAEHPELHRKQERERYYKNPERHRERNRLRYQKKKKQILAQMKRHRLQRDYGITPEIFDQIFKSQGSCCAICQRTKFTSNGWHIDHCHRSNVVRGILCSRCNMMLGLADDDPQRLETARRYLIATPINVAYLNKK